MVLDTLWGDWFKNATKTMLVYDAAAETGISLNAGLYYRPTFALVIDCGFHLLETTLFSIN